MKSFINSNFKNSLCLSLNRSVYSISLKSIRSVAGIRSVERSPERMEIEDVIGLRSGKVGTILLNKEHKSNVLSEAFMEDVRRSLEAMEIDEDMKVVVLKAKNNEVFSMGTDLNYLYCRKKQGEVEKIHEYYQNLYNFQNFIASYHKPLLALGNGILKGSGVSMLSSSSYPMSTTHTQASFPEASYGYVPDGGSVFFLSRLAGEMGVFLALTGYKLVDWDLVHLKLASDLTVTDLSVPLDRRVFGQNFNQSLNDWAEKWPEVFKKSQDAKNEYNQNGVNDLLNSEEKMKMDFFKYNETYTYPWERDGKGNDQGPNYSSLQHSMVANEFNKGNNTNTNTNTNTKTNSNAMGTSNKTESKFNYKDWDGRIFTNTAQQFYDTVYSGLPILSPQYFSLIHVLKDIDRLFRFQTVPEILDALHNENSQFAEWCIAMLESKSALSLAVTLKMLSNAKTLNYYEIITQEINVANNMVMKNPDFEVFMERKMNKSANKSGDKTVYKFAKSIKEVTKEEVDSMFKDSKILSKINLDVKPNSLLPHNRYLLDHPDCFRLWINETPRANVLIRKHFDYEIKNYLIHKFGIDIRDTNISIDEVREVMSKIYTNEFTTTKNINKLGSLISNNKFMSEYVSKRHEVIEKYTNDKSILKEIVDRKLKAVFENSLIKNSKEVYKKCEEVRDLEKKRTWVRLKRWLFMNRVMSYKGKEKLINAARVSALGSRKLFIPYKLDVSYRDMQNPLVKKSPFYQLAGLFNLKKIAPEYAMRFATSNNNGSLFEYLDLNKDKLNEIKHKLKTDPKSFIDIWNSAIDKDAEDAFNSVEDPTLIEYERVYRLRHEGHSTLDKLPYYKEYVEFKNNWMATKKKTTELLRKIMIDVIEDVIEKEDTYGKSLIELNRDESAKSKLDEESLENIKTLYGIVKTNNENENEENDMSFFRNTRPDAGKIIKNNVDSLIKNDGFFQMLTQLAETKGDLYSSFKNKVSDLTQSLIIINLIKNDTVEGNNISTLTTEEIELHLKKLFSSSLSSSNNEFIDFLYAKYGTQNIFVEILNKSKLTTISLIKNLVENELFMHNNNLLSTLKDGQIEKIKSIYNKEKSLLEDVLKSYYDIKIQIINMDLMVKGENSSSITIDDFISQLKEITFSHLILSDQKEVPASFDLLISKINDKNKVKELIELYVNLNELNMDPKMLSSLSTLMKNSEWFSKVEAYSQSQNLDSQIENFMKSKFNDIVFNNKINSVDYLVDKRKLNEIVKDKFDVDYLKTLVEDYQSGKKIINEDKDDKVFSEPAKLETKIDFYTLRLELNDKLNKIERQYNLGNLKTKYTDYIFNANFYIHKVLCNIKNVDEIYTGEKTKIENVLEYGKFLFDIKKTLDQTHFDLTKTKNSTQEFIHSSHVNRLRSLLFNQKDYVADLEKLNNFIDNKIKFNELIFENLYDDLSFTNKFEINLLVNDIQTDSEKLFNHLTKGSNQINKVDFIINDEEFYNNFKNINFDEFIGLGEDTSASFSYLSELQNRIKRILSKRSEDSITDYDREEVENLVRKLITYEVLKSKNENVPMAEFSSLMSEVVERERSAYDELVRDGKLPEQMRKRNNTATTEAHIRELIDSAHNLQVAQANNNNNNTKKFSMRKCLNKNLADKLNLKIKGLSTKVLSTIQGLKHLQYIQSNKETIYRDPSNLNTIAGSLLSFDEFAKKQETPGLKFSKIAEILLGRKYSLQELILDDRQKTISDYGNDNAFQQLFSKKLPVDMIKTTLEVFDARLIKALKFIFASEKDRECFITPDDLITDYGGDFYLNHKMSYIKGEDMSFIKTLQIVAQDIEEEAMELKIDQVDQPETFTEIDQTVEEGKKKIEEYKIDLKNAIIDDNGSGKLLKYKKKSLFDALLKINKLEPGQKHIVSQNILKKLNSIVPIPDFSSQYTVLKYIYDYYMGTLQVSYENYREEAENRILELNAALRFEKLEKLAKIDPILIHANREEFYMNPEKAFPDSALNPKNDWQADKLPVSFERDVNPLPKDHIEKSYYISKEKESLYRPIDKTDKKKIEHHLNLAFSIFYSRDPQNYNWTVSNGPNHAYSALVDNELQRYFDVSHYLILKRQGILEDTFKRTKAMTMLLTEDFRTQAEGVEKSNKKLRELQFNTYEKESVGFEHLYKNHKSEYDTVLDDLFGEYLKNKKEGLNYTKAKLQEQKEKVSSIENLPVTNPYQVLKQSQEAYYEMKSGMKDDSRMKLDINTYLKASSMDKEYPTFHHSDLTEIVDLDNATSRALYGKYASIPKHLVEAAEKVDLGKHIFDKTEEEWFEDQIEKMLVKFFKQRSKLEKTLTREELYAVDQGLLNNFTHENVIDGVKQNLNGELLKFNLYNDIVESQRNGACDQERQRLKFENKQYDFNRNMKDENAYFQHMAYVYRMEKETQDKINADLQIKKKTTGSTKVDKNISSPLDNPKGFEHLYAKDLMFNQVYNGNRKEDSEKYMSRYNKREFNNLGRTQFAQGYTGKEKLDHMRSVTEKIERNPNKINEIYQKKAGEIVSILKEKADKIDQIDRFNNYMSAMGKQH